MDKSYWSTVAFIHLHIVVAFALQWGWASVKETTCDANLFTLMLGAL